MMSRQMLRPLSKITVRAFATGEKLIDLKMDNEGIAVMSWQKQPVNSVNLKFLQAISNSLDELENNQKYKGLIMTSAIPKIFSAGIDLNELNKPDPERLSTFWKAFQGLFLRIYGSEVPATVAIKGYAAAGACVISLMCDYRVMVNDQSKIGLNDTAVGIVPATWVCEIMTRAMGDRQAEIAITSSKMYTAEEALKAQMIDEIAADQDDAIEKCKKFIRLYDNIPRNIQSAAKRQLRGSTLKYVDENREKDAQMFLKNILNTQELIGKYVEQLQQRKSKR